MNKGDVGVARDELSNTCKSKSYVKMPVRALRYIKSLPEEQAANNYVFSGKDPSI